MRVLDISPGAGGGRQEDDLEAGEEVDEAQGEEDLQEQLQDPHHHLHPRMSFRPGWSWEVVTWAASRSRSGWAVRAEVAGESETRRSQGTSHTRGGRQPRL